MQIITDYTEHMRRMSEDSDYNREFTRQTDILMDDLRLLGLKGFMKKHNKNQSTGKIFFITINPKSDVDLMLFKKLKDVFIRRTFIKNPVFAFEQTGTEEGGDVGKHPHLHILIDKPHGMTPQQIIDRAYSTFKNVCGSKQSVDVKQYDSSLREEKEEYLRGNKWSPEKEASCRANANWRVKNNLY